MQDEIDDIIDGSIDLEAMSAEQLKRYVTIKKRQKQLGLTTCFDASNIYSKPNDKQTIILKDTLTLYRIIRCGNQCLAEGTMVMTKTGPMAIEDITPGMTVYSEHGTPIKVLDTFKNGEKEVIEINNRYNIWAEATLDHVFQVRDRLGGKIKEKSINTFSRDTAIRRVEVDCPMGEVTPLYPYSLGAFLGDGCSKEKIKAPVISSADYRIPNKVAVQLGGGAVSLHQNNYSWKIVDHFKLPDYYEAWCKGRYAHEKIIDLTIVKTWDRASILQLVAGIIDTDGSVYVDSWDNIVVTVSMQSESIINFLQWAFLTLWQTPVKLGIDDRDKYVHGPCHTLKVASNAFSIRILKELDPHLVTPSKKWKESYSTLVSKRSDSFWIGAKLGKTRVVETYDIHVDSPTNLYLLANGLVTHNSGKTNTMVRDYAWKLSETHPYWKRRTSKECPSCSSKQHIELVDRSTRGYRCSSCEYKWRSWGDESLTFLCVLQTGKQIDDLWEKRLKPFFSTTEVEPEVKGGILQSVTHTGTGNKIIFFSHDNATEVRKRIQYFVAHDVWIDEMPGHYKVYEELMRRVDAMQGQFSATLTPKVKNPEAKEFIDNLDPSLHSLHRMSKLDNPIYAQTKDEEMAKLSSLPEADRNAILWGDWVTSGELRLNINPQQIVPLPDRYSRTWDHVEVVDPASAGKCGFVMFAKDPIDIVTWYVVRACYVGGDAPSTLVREVLPEYEAGYNIVRRVADPHEAWFIKESAKYSSELRAQGRQSLEYHSPFNKKDRRKELLGLAEEALINPHMLFVKDETIPLTKEFSSAQENPDKPGDIKNASRYHCIDAFIYGLDLLPTYTTPPKPMTPQEAFRAMCLEQEARNDVMGQLPQKIVPQISVSARASKIMKRESVRWARRR